jgi:DNA polymerase-1
VTPEQLDLAVWPIFARMTERGLRVDVGKLLGLRADVEAELDAQEAALCAYAGSDLNPYSPAAVAKWISAEGFSGRRTRGGLLSTDERALSLLTDLHPVPGCVLECRGLRKLISTFIDPTLEIAAKHDGVVHPRWRLTRVKSGRPSCEDPNLLAFPTRDALGKRVRDCFVARPGHVLVSVDFSQIEPRVAAALSQDPALISVFAEGRDLYADTARRIFRTEASDEALKTEPLKTKHRQPAKTILLGCVLYGMQPDLLYDTLIKIGCGTPSAPFYDHDACEYFVRRRFEPYPRLQTLFDRTVMEARRADGWASTRGGRQRFLPALLCEGRRWPAAKLREEAERQAFNHLIQGTAQEIMKGAMLRVDADALISGVAYPLLQIYDELVFEVGDLTVGAAEAAMERLTSLMAGSTLDGVEIKASASVAETWGGLK